MKKLLFTGLVTLLAIAAGIAIWPDQVSITPSPTKPATDAPALRIHGSNTVGEKLMPALVTAFLEGRGYALVRTEVGAQPVEKTISARIHQTLPNVNIEVHAHGSSTAFQDLDQGTTDLGMSSRKIKPEELDMLKDRFGDLTTAKQEHVIALDALAIIVHTDNPLEQLTIEQIAGIFSGEISDWSQLGLPTNPITVYTRDDKSGTWDTFENLVLKKYEKKLVGTARRYESSEELTNSVRKDRNGIGFVGVAYANQIKLLGVSADGKKAYTKPGKHNIGTEAYALSRRLFVYEPLGVNNALATEFLAFAVSDTGQRLVESIGLIAYYPTRDKPRIALQPYPPRYQSLGTLGERLSVTFRVDGNSLLADDKLNRDLDRVINFFRDHPEKRLVLAELIPPSISKTRKDNEALTELERRLSAAQLTPYDRVLVDYGPEGFDAISNQIEMWAL